MSNPLGSIQPLGVPRWYAYDSNGNPLSGGLLYSYMSGTSTPLATYTDSTGNTANPNPVALDSAGSANVWMTPGLLYKFVLKDSGGALIWSVDGYPSPANASASTDVASTEPGGRLSLTSGTPVTTVDVTAATTVYYVPHKSDKVPLYDGTNWALYSVGTQLSQATTDNTKSPAAVANNSNYDLFVWNDSGTVRLSRGPAWTSDTARGTGVGTTEIAQVNGRYVNKNSITNGPGANLGLYVGTVRSDGSAQINDSAAKRHVWNCHNRIIRPMSVHDATASWTYGGALRQANANAANQLDYVCGLAEDSVTARALHAASINGATYAFATAIGRDSTTVASGFWAASNLNDNNLVSHSSAYYTGIPGLGRHYLAWLEYSQGSGLTWGDGSVAPQTGISGEVLG